MNRGTPIAFSTVLALLGVMLSCSTDQLAFNELIRERRNPVQARRIATALMESPSGIELAVQDFDCFGGRTMGWSNWMLKHSDLEKVDTLLLSCLNVHEFGLEKRVAAAWILWSRTGDADYLRQLFEMVKESDGYAVKAGRRYLAMASSGDSIREVFLAEPSSALKLSEDDFQEMLQKGLVGRTEDQESARPKILDLEAL